MNRTNLQTLWNDLHTQNTWVTGANNALAGLTPEQAAWKPAPERHSIWQLVNHLIFWHTYHLAHTRTGGTLPREQVMERNWQEPTTTSDDAWRQTLASYESMRREVSTALDDPGFKLDNIPNMLMHTSYHLGQIMQLRAMQGLPPIE